MKSMKEDEDNWSNNIPAFNFDDRKHDFDGITKYSVRSARHMPVVVSSPGLMSAEPLSFSIKSENDLEYPELSCHSCSKIITGTDNCKYEGGKVFTNDICWQQWMDKMIENEDINVREFCSFASKQYCLRRVTSSCNGQLILKVTLALKTVTEPSQFESLLYDSPMACNNYMAFLKETGQTDNTISGVKSKYQLEEDMYRLRKLFSDNSEVSATAVRQFMDQLSEFRTIRLQSLNIPLVCEMVREYVNLLDWQYKNNKEFINAPLIETLMSNKVSYQAIRDSSKAKYLKDTFKLTPEEFVWTSMRTIVDENNVAEIDNLFNNKIIGNRPDIQYQRVVSYLVFLNREPDEIKMKCLSKISNISELVECANMWRLLPAYIEYCKKNKDNSQLKKIQAVHGYKK